MVGSTERPWTVMHIKANPHLMFYSVREWVGGYPSHSLPFGVPCMQPRSGCGPGFKSQEGRFETALSEYLDPLDCGGDRGGTAGRPETGGDRDLRGADTGLLRGAGERSAAGKAICPRMGALCLSW